jgi:predicted MPP superfamily phosphohydrolase
MAAPDEQSDRETSRGGVAALLARRRTPGGHVRFLQLVTAGALAPAAVGVFRLFVPLGAPTAAVIAAATSAVVLAPVEARIRFGFEDARRTMAERNLAVLYDMLWMTALFTPLTSALAAVVLAASGRGPIPFACELGLAAGAALAAYGVLVRRWWVRERALRVRLPGLPSSFDGYRVVHLSDLHVGSIDRKERASAWIEAANAREADLIVVTGDLLTTGTAYHDDVVEVLSGLRARDGVYGCLGNHDYYGEDTLCAKLAARGVRILRNEGVALARGGDTLWLAGVEDVWRGQVDLARALRDRPEAVPAILLAHNPDFFPHARDAGIALTLSGHTHAGQLAVPFLTSRATLSHLVTRWPAGLFREGSSQLFVHAGLGTTGPAIRLGAAPEVVEIELVPDLPR